MSDKQATYHLLFNAVGALIGLIVVGYVVYALFQIEREEPCHARYPAPTRFSLVTAAGAPLSPIELQGRAGLGEWGVLDNAKVVAIQEPPGNALEVKLRPVESEATHSAARPANGVDFRWMPLGMKSASAVCLDYSVFIPDKFPFNEQGGALPGVIGGPPPPAKIDAANRLAVRLQWTGDGKGILYIAPTGSAFRGINLSGFPLEPGRWTRVEQEVVLNTPGEANGVVRLWVDGTLEAESEGVELRKDKADGITGVLGDIGYLRQPPGDVPSLRFSAFEISWR